MQEAMHRIAENLAAVRETMAVAAARSGRAADEVQLVAVTKYVSAGLAREVAAAGCLDLGESRPQELWEKAEQLTDLPIRWHLIGHLQTNKVKRTLPFVRLLHSLDSEHLGDAVERWAAQQGTTVAALLEVNISGDPTKHGYSPDEAVSVIVRASGWPHVQLLGLMAMASQIGGRDEARRNFASLRQLRDHIVSRFPDGPPLRELSMGMSADYDVAIEEGATIVRVGSALFEGIDL
jgi:pyridoxal phosphate enzyme (YggS family)